MGLFDKFITPKYKNKDWTVREAATRKLTDKSILVDIAKNDEHPKVRLAATNKITDQNVLKEITLLELRRGYINSNFEDVVVRIEDREFLGCLTDLVKNESYEYRKVTRETLIPLEMNYVRSRIGEPDLISACANVRTDDAYKYIAENISDEKTLFLIANNGSEYSSARQVAIKKLSDEEHLISITKSEYSISRIAAIENPNFNNQEVLENLAKHDESSNVRQEATRKIKNQKTLKELAYGDDWAVREIAMKNIGDEDEIISLAKNDNAEYVHRATAIDIITNQDVLIDIALNVKNINIRSRAVEKITDEEFLTKIALNDDEDFVRSAAIKNPNLTNQETLLTIAKKPDEGYKTYAILKIKDTNLKEGLLFDVAKNDDSCFCREDAIDSMTDINNLKYLRDHDSRVKHYDSRMDDEGNIHDAYDYYPTRECAKKRLAKLGY